MRRVFCGVALVTVIGAMGANAEDQIGSAENPRAIPDTIVVTANRKPTPSRQVASSVTVISAQEIEKSQANAVSELLRTVPGVDVVQSGGEGKITSVFMRGANSHHTLVIVDGVEMNDPSSPNGSFDFANLNVNNIERIEILRGSHSVLYGSDAIGGVIQIFSKRGYGKPKVELNSETGAYNTFNETARLYGNSGVVDYSLALSRRDTDGFSSVSKHSGGIENDGHWNTEFSGQVGILVPNHINVSIAAKLTEAEADIDQSGGMLDDPNYINKARSSSLSVSFQREAPESFWTPVISLNVLDINFESEDRVDSSHPNQSSDYHTHGRKTKLSALNSFEIAAFDVLTIGLETEREQFNSTYASASAWGAYHDTVGEVRSKTSSVFLLNEYSLRDRLFATIGLRYDNHNEYGARYTYRATSAYHVGNTGLKLKASYGTGFKSPSLFQLFHELYGNPNLQPEESVTWEVGLEERHRASGFSIGVVYFNNRYDNLIGFDPMTYLPVNIGLAVSRGVEALIGLRAPHRSVQIDYTYTETENRSDDTPIIRRPKNKISATASYTIGPRLGVNLRVTHVGSRLDNDFASMETVTLGSYTVTNLSASYDATDWLELKARIHNLFDERYEEVLTYGTSKRAAYVGVGMNL